MSRAPHLTLIFHDSTLYSCPEIAFGKHRASGPKRTLALCSEQRLTGSSCHFLSAKVVPALPSPALTTVPLLRLPSSPIAVGSVLALDPGLGCLHLTACCVGVFKFCLYQSISTHPDFGMYPMTPIFVTLSEGSSHLYPQ